jgi:ABC-2 type transport system permease protein
MLMKLFLFEFKKITRSRTVLLFLLLSILMVCGLFFKNTILQDRIAIQKIERFSEYSYEVSNGIQGDDFLLKGGADAEVEARLEVGHLLSDQLKYLIMTIQNNQWKEELKAEIDVYNTAMTYKEMEGSFRANVSDMKETIKLNEKLLEVGLPKEDLELSVQPTIFLKKVVFLFHNTFGFLVIVLVLGTLITREFEENNIRMVYVLPVSSTKYILVKFFSLLIIGIIWLIIVLLLSYLLPFLFGHTAGDIFNYPLFTSEGNFITSGDYIKQAISYGLLFMTFTVALLVVLGFLIRNTILTYLIVTFLFIGTFFALENGLTAIFNPFTYQNIDYIVLNETGYYPMGLLVLFVTTVLLLILTMTFMRKRGGPS